MGKDSMLNRTSGLLNRCPYDYEMDAARKGATDVYSKSLSMRTGH